MKVLYFQSAYKGIYSYFDLWLKEVSSEKIDLISIPISTNQTMLKNLILTIKPTYIFMMIGNSKPIHLLKLINEMKIPLILWFTEDPFYIDVSYELLPYADCILSIDQSSCEFYSKLGDKQIHYLPLATNENIFKPINRNKDIDLLLIGYPYPSRIKLVQLIIDSTNYSIVLIGKNWRKSLNISIQRKKNIRFVTNWIPPNIVNYWYNRAKIILNPHRESTFLLNKNRFHVINRSVNNRFFDIALSGGFQLINDKIDPFVDEEIESLFRYSDEKNCIDLIHKFINESSNRDKITTEIRSKMIGKNTFSDRLKTLKNILGQNSI